MANVTEYTGTAALGLGSTPGIPVTSNKDLDLINQTSRDIYYSNISRNQQLFQQKLKDRDQLLSAIDSGDIKVGDILEEDNPTVKEGLEKLDEAFYKRIKKGVNDLDAAREYKKALREAQDRVTQAQGRKVFYDSESVLVGKETLPRKQEARKKNLDNVIKGGFWKDITPYQQTQDLDIEGSILSTAKNVTTEFTDPKTLTKGKRTLFDYDKTKLANQDNFLNDATKRYDQQQLLQSIQSLQPPQFVETVTAMNNRIKEYNDLKGLVDGAEGYVAPLKVEMVNNRPMIAESLPDFAAKYTLAHQKPFGSLETEFDKDRAAYLLGQERNRIGRINAGANATRARAYADLQNKKVADLDNDEKRVKGFWGGVVDRVHEIKGGGHKISMEDLPKGFSFMAGVNAKGEPIELLPMQDGNRKFYSTRIRSAGLPDIPVGGDVTPAYLKKTFTEFKGLGGKGDYNTWLRNSIKNGYIDLEVLGANGAADFQSAMQSARALSNKLGSGKEEPVFSETETNDQPYQPDN